MESGLSTSSKGRGKAKEKDHFEAPKVITEGYRGSTSTIGRGKIPLFPFPQYIWHALQISFKAILVVSLIAKKSESDKIMYLKLVFGEGAGQVLAGPCRTLAGLIVLALFPPHGTEWCYLMAKKERFGK